METSVLITRIEAYCLAHHVSPSTFGRKAVNDGKLVERLKAGKTITLHTFSRIDSFLNTQPNGGSLRSRHVTVSPRDLPAAGCR